MNIDVFVRYTAEVGRADESRRRSISVSVDTLTLLLTFATRYQLHASQVEVGASQSRYHDRFIGTYW